MVAANAEPVVGILDGPDVFPVPKHETDGPLVEEGNGAYL